jgi:phosphopantetheinyl transferase
MLESFFGTTAEPVSLQGFYLAWTFGEAYFKAFGSLPGKETLADVIERQAGNGTYRLRHRENGAVGVLHSEVKGEFALTLVWVPCVGTRSLALCCR